MSLHKNSQKEQFDNFVERAMLKSDFTVMQIYLYLKWFSCMQFDLPLISDYDVSRSTIWPQ